MGQLPLPNNDTSLANAVAVDGNTIYLIGSFGDCYFLEALVGVASYCVISRDDAGTDSQAFITRISAQDMDLGAYDRIELWSNANVWIPYSDFNVSNVAILFDFMASETTLQYHDILQAWFVIIVNSFAYGPTIMIRVATLPNGSWSKPIPVYTIPSQFLQHGDFCYAGKVILFLATLFLSFIFLHICLFST
jgi:hypothetical protein